MRARRFLYCWLCFGGCLDAQEGAGQAEISPQQYYFVVDSHRVASISGVGLRFSQFIPDVGLVSGSLLPAASNNRFRNGDSFLQLKGLPWIGQHWTFTAGDFRLPGQLLAIPFTNLNFPEIAARGGAIEMTHGARTLGFFYGQGTISNTPRVVLRQQVPQTLIGAYWRQGVGTRLLLGARFMHFSNDIAALRKLPGFLTQTTLANDTTLSLDSLYTLAGPLKLYGEATWSMAGQEGSNPAARNGALSTLAGPILDTKVLTLRANYTFQSAAYFPLLGYYLGDRAGPFVEVKYHPVDRLEIYGSASQYENNVARNPAFATFRNSSESAGASIQLPGRISLNGQFTMLRLSTRANAASPWLESADQQKAVTLSRTFARHNLRLTARDFRDVSPFNSQRQRSAEIEDNFHIRRLTLGGGVRLQRLIARESRSSLFYRGSAQFQLRWLSAYANFETGNDLQSRTLLATNTVSTTVLGASSNLGKNWEFQAEAFRNNLLTELNPQSIFVLQGRGVFIPGTLAALNQWSMYFRVTRRFHWGKAGALGDLTRYAISKTPLKGSVEGYVMERLADGNHPAEGVTVSIDQSRTALTDANGHFRFPDVAEGRRKVALALHELPAEFEVGKNTETALLVSPSKLARADFDVVRLASVSGKIRGPKDVAVESIVIRMLPGERYTTPDTEGNFSFYNIRAGIYTFAVDEKTLPEFGVLNQPGRVLVSVQVGVEAAPVTFGFEIHKPEKPVRNVPIAKAAVPEPPRVDRSAVPEPPVAARSATPELPRVDRSAVPESPVAARSATPELPRVDRSAVPEPLRVDRSAMPETMPIQGARFAARPASSASAQEHHVLGRKLIQTGRYREAIQELSDAIRLAPDFALAYNARGFAWLSLRDYPRAIADLDGAIRLNPKYANAFQVRAAARREIGDAAGAQADLARVKELSPR